jgi:hypothetical protein
MVENMIRQTSKKTWYKWSFYINIILFFIIALFIYLLIKDSYQYGKDEGDLWLNITRDVAFIAIALAIIFFQFFKNLMVIMRRSL